MNYTNHYAMLGKSFVPDRIGYAPRYDCGCCSVRYGETKGSYKKYYRRVLRHRENQRWRNRWEREY